MFTALAIASLLAYSPGSPAPPDDPVADFLVWADAAGFELTSAACAPNLAGTICYGSDLSAIPPRIVTLSIPRVGQPVPLVFVFPEGMASASPAIEPAGNPWMVDGTAIELFIASPAAVQMCDVYRMSRALSDSITGVALREATVSYADAQIAYSAFEAYGYQLTPEARDALTQWLRRDCS